MKNITAGTVFKLAFGIALFFGATTAHAQHGNCGHHPLRVVYCGHDGLSLRCGPGTHNHRLGTVHQGATLYPTGESLWSCGVLWQKVAVRGYMKIGGCSKYLTHRGNGFWEVTWYRPGDNFVSMRSATSSRSCLLAKIHTGSFVRSHYDRHGYLEAEAEGWVAVRTARGKVYVR